MLSDVESWKKGMQEWYDRAMKLEADKATLNAGIERLRAENAALQADAALGRKVHNMRSGWLLGYVACNLANPWSVSYVVQGERHLITAATPEEALEKAAKA